MIAGQGNLHESGLTWLGSEMQKGLLRDTFDYNLVELNPKKQRLTAAMSRVTEFDSG
jgi:hypothetical protein